VAEGRAEPGTGRVCVGVITSAHGVRGAVRVKSFTASPGAIGEFDLLRDEAGCALRLEVKEVRAKVVIAAVAGVDDRAAAERLRGTKLFVPRSALPQAGAEEYYHADLIGAACERGDGSVLGTVRAVNDFGAGDVLEIAGPGGTLMVPFTAEAVPVVDLANRRLVIEPPPGLPGIEEDRGE
jgi:16S rRNA processing protein RimM